MEALKIQSVTAIHAMGALPEWCLAYPEISASAQGADSVTFYQVTLNSGETIAPERVAALWSAHPELRQAVQLAQRQGI